MRPQQSNEPLQQRVYRELAEQLQAWLEGQDMHWPAVDAAQRRMRARARLTVLGCLQRGDHGALAADALAVLGDDSGDQAARDEALVYRWWQAQGGVLDAAGARERIAHRLDQMAARQQAYTLSLTTP